MAAVVDTDGRLARYEDLAVRVGANLQPGQTLFVASQIEHAPLARAIARAGYRAGARYVDVSYRDDLYDVVMRERVRHDALREVAQRDLSACR